VPPAAAALRRGPLARCPRRHDGAPPRSWSRNRRGADERCGGQACERDSASVKGRKGRLLAWGSEGCRAPGRSRVSEVCRRGSRGTAIVSAGFAARAWAPTDGVGAHRRRAARRCRRGSPSSAFSLCPGAASTGATQGARVAREEPSLLGGTMGFLGMTRPQTVVRSLAAKRQERASHEEDEGRVPRCDDHVQAGGSPVRIRRHPRRGAIAASSAASTACGPCLAPAAREFTVAAPSNLQGPEVVGRDRGIVGWSHTPRVLTRQVSASADFGDARGRYRKPPRRWGQDPGWPKRAARRAGATPGARRCAPPCPAWRARAPRRRRAGPSSPGRRAAPPRGRRA